MAKHSFVNDQIALILLYQPQQDYVVKIPWYRRDGHQYKYWQCLKIVIRWVNSSCYRMHLAYIWQNSNLKILILNIEQQPWMLITTTTITLPSSAFPHHGKYFLTCCKLLGLFRLSSAASFYCPSCWIWPSQDHWCPCCKQHWPRSQDLLWIEDCLA